jgi:hypothetical protein
MATARLEAFLGLNTKQFQRALTKARSEAAAFAKAGLAVMGAASITAGAALAAGTKRILSMGGALTDLRDQTGASVRALLTLQTALKAAGVDAGKLGPALNRMQKGLVDAERGTGEAVKGLDLMGLSLADLRGHSVVGQFATIARQLGAIEDPAKRAAAAMAIFGDAGASMGAFFQDSGAIDDAVASLGKMPEVMDRFANAFDRADDILGRLPQKADQFFTGFASEIVGSILGPLEEVNRLDFTELGQRLGAAIRPWIEGLKNGDAFRLFGLYGTRAALGFAGDMVDAAQDIGRAIVASLQAAFDVSADFFSKTMLRAVAEAFAGIYDKLSGLPVIGGQFGNAASGFRNIASAVPEARSFGEAYAERRPTMGDGQLGDEIRATLDPVIAAFKGSMASAGDASYAAAAGMGATTKIVGKTADDGLNSSLKTLTTRVETASEAFNNLFGGGEQTGPLGSAKKKVDRLESEASRLDAQANRFRAHAAQAQADGIRPAYESNLSAAADAANRAAEMRTQAEAIVSALIPKGVGTSGTASAGVQDLGPAGSSGGGGSGGGNDGLASQVQALIGSVGSLVGELAAIRAKLVVA